MVEFGFPNRETGDNVVATPTCGGPQFVPLWDGGGLSAVCCIED